jgi:DNA oxidative demethylase
MTAHLFDTPAPQELLPDVWLLSGWASSQALLHEIDAISTLAPFRHFPLAGGGQMQAAMSNCGALGWTSSRAGYAYSRVDPLSQKPWPAMPAAFEHLAHQAAAQCGWLDFSPDACLINRYQAGMGMSLHRDDSERDLRQPIVSVSLGDSCDFKIGGLQRTDPIHQLTLHNGDVLVWGGTARLIHHAVKPLPAGALRYNLTFRRAE